MRLDRSNLGSHVSKSISILIPTLNAGRTLEACLASIAAQEYSRDQLEIIIADGGSTDKTLEIALRYRATICPNPLKTGEAGKAVALKQATGEIVAFVDSDNVLPQPDWLTRMVEPFDDPEIAGAEPVEYTWRPTDRFITRYGALMGMGDPLCLFLGNYDRYSLLTRRWTDMPVGVQDCGGYLRVTLDEQHLPTIGANGFLVLRSSAMAACAGAEYVFDIDLVHEILRQDRCKFAKVKVGVVHIFSGNVQTLVRKQLRRVNDYYYYNRSNLRRYPWKNMNRAGLFKFIAYCLLVIPLLTQSVIGYVRRRDRAWFFHPVACWITLVVYAYGTLRGLFVARPQDRTGWSQ